MKRLAVGMLVALLVVPVVSWAQGDEIKNKAVVLKMIELVNRHELDKLGEVIDPAFVDHGPSAGGALEGFKKGVGLMHASFPNLILAAEELVADGDKVTLRATLSGTFSGKPMFGVPSTGQSAKWLTLMTFRVANGKLAERWTEADTWGMLQQIGVLPAAQWGDMSAMAVAPVRNAEQEKKNKELAGQFVKEIWMDRKVDGIDKFFAAGGGLSGGVPANGGMLLAPALIKMVAESVFMAFPDFQATVDFVMAEGDTVVVRISETGTQKADYMGVPASGKKVSWSDTFFLTMKDGKIAKAWLQANQMGLMSQIGGFKPLVPAKPAEVTAEAPAAPAPVVPPATVYIATNNLSPAAAKNMAVMTRFIEEFWNQRKFDIASEIIDPEHFSSSLPMLPKGPDGMKMIAGFVAGGIFPDLKREVKILFATDDMIGAVWVNSGTHTGTYMNCPGTGKKVEWTELCIARFKDGKMIESWYRPDEFGLLKQIVPEKLETIHM